MKIQGKTSKEYLESIKAYIAEHDQINCVSVKAQAENPESSTLRNIRTKCPGDTLRGIQEDLAEALANYATWQGAGNYDLADEERAKFFAIIKTLGRCDILPSCNYYMLVAIRNLVQSFPPECGVTYDDAMKLIKEYVF